MSGSESAKRHAELTRNRVRELREQAESIARFRDATMAGRIGVWSMDFRTGKLFVDPAVMEILGYSEDELPEQMNAWQRFVHEEDRMARDRIVAACREGRSDRYELEYRVLTKDGGTRWIHSRGQVVQDEAGRPARLIGIGMDVTERHAAEEEREELRRQLEQARQAESIGTLAGGVAHDFNNILAVVLGNAQLALAKEAAGEPVADNVREILAAAVRGRDIVRQILAFSRPTPGRKCPVPIESVVAEALEFVRPFIPRQIEIRTDFRTGGALVGAEPSHLHQVLLNLCANARDAMPEGGVISVALRVERHEEPFDGGRRELPAGEWVALEVRDDGHGIDPENRERVFDPFFTTKHSGQGTGLGLSMVSAIITDHGGDVLVAGRPGGGTKILVRLPVSAPGSGTEENREGEALHGQGLVLFVDDEESIVHVGSSMLRSLGYDVEAFANASEALRAFDRSPGRYDAVVTDQGMPHLTGLRFAREIGRRRPGLPVVLCTGFSESVSDESLREAGVAELLMKPYTETELSVSLRRALAGGSP
ncbi:PAS domain-containing protein [bacterium]|nr:PAS domain-containing protein [bacterium]